MRTGIHKHHKSCYIRGIKGARYKGCYLMVWCMIELVHTTSYVAQYELMVISCARVDEKVRPGLCTYHNS